MMGLNKKSVGVAMLLALAGSASAEVVVSEAWIRLLPPGVSTTAAYATLTSDDDDRLVAAATPIAMSAEIHESAMENGVMQMNHIEAIALPAGETVTLSPGGLHLMVMGLQQTLEAGQQVEMQLEFDESGTQTVMFEVRAP